MHDRAAIFGALDAALRGNGPPHLNVGDALKRWHDAAHTVFIRDASAQSVRPALVRSHWQVSYVVESDDGQILKQENLKEILRQVYAEVQDTVRSGWNMIDPYGVMMLTPYWEDSLGQQNQPNAGTWLSPNWTVRSLAEIVRHARGMTERFDNPTAVTFRCEWHGLRDRKLHSPGTLWSMRSFVSRSDQRTAVGSYPVTMLPNSWPDVVADLVAPLMRSFSTDEVLDPSWIRGQAPNWLRHG
jgi:hypothetical protein